MARKVNARLPAKHRATTTDLDITSTQMIADRSRTNPVTSACSPAVPFSRSAGRS